MILLNDFYTLVRIDSGASTVKATIAINKAHKIFQGHFPGLPVVPGVCMLQMVKEIMEVNVGRELMIRAADNMKFLSVINPDQNSQVEALVNYTQEADRLSINATLFAGTVTFFKLKATLEFS
jgi:3-hydroxyacyl-[acyl-carrier-protein] dehydratase